MYVSPLKDHSTRMRITSEDLTIIQFIVVVDSSVGHTKSHSHASNPAQSQHSKKKKRPRTYYFTYV